MERKPNEEKQVEYFLKITHYRKSMAQLLILVTIGYLSMVNQMILGQEESKVSNFTTNLGCEHVLVPEDSILSRSNQSVIACAVLCLKLPGCLSVQHNVRDRTCVLSNMTTTFGCENLTTDVNFYHYEEPCLNGGYMKEDGECKCVGGWIGGRCEKLMSNCVEGVPYGHERGVFSLHAEGATSPVKVYCSHAGRIFILRHISRNVNMNRSWSEYKNGFGTPGADSWLGLDTLHHISSQLRYRLITYILLHNKTYARSQHRNFHVGNESTNYVMSYAFAHVNVNNTLGDSLVAMNGQPFSTYDNDNDNDPTRNCAAEYGGGYWFNACGRCNPTGKLSNSDTEYRSNVSDELFWTDDLGDLAGYRIIQFLYYDGTW